MYVNKALKKMKEGKPALGAVCGTCSPLAAELLALSGLDFVKVDNQHGLWQPQEMMAAFRAIHAAGAVPMGRVLKNDFGQINEMLDRGAMGIVVPMVNTVADARAAAFAMRFPPEGGRSGGWYGCGVYGSDYKSWINREVFLAVQIETKEAVDNVEEIMAVPGVDGCWVGPGDLSFSMDVPLWSEPHKAAISKVLAACKKLGKIPGIAFGDMAQFIKDGFLFVTPCDDFSAIRNYTQMIMRSLGA
jgi:2-keto-3-deoxy-L-rhamnonate aldolase RhmA